MKSAMVSDSDEMMVDPRLIQEVDQLHVSTSVEDEDTEDYEEDDESEDERVILGSVKDPKNEWSLTRQYFPSKAGGVPAWLDPVDIPSGRQCRCDICGVPLQFLLQVYKPIFHRESTFHRTLFVFICKSLSCLIQHQRKQQNCHQQKTSRSVKVFRCQLPRLNPYYSYYPPNEDGTAKPLCIGALLCDECGSWKRDKECSSCRISSYCSDIHLAAHWASCHKTECCQTASVSYEEPGSDDSIDIQMEKPKAAACKLLWPEMEIIQKEVDESSNKDSSQDKIDIDSYVPNDELDDDSTVAFMNELEGDDDQKSWVTFQERMAKATGQVLRCWRSPEAKPLWALATGRPSKSNIPKCNHCGGELSFEFQIMPQLLHYLGVEKDENPINWGTVVVYTCQASCDGGPSYKDEFAWVQPSY